MNLKNAWIYQTEEKCFTKGALTIEDGKIVSFEEARDAVDLDGAYVIPGMVDIHTHGRGGYDFCTASVADLPKMAKSYARCGTTTVVPTFASAPFADLLQAMKQTSDFSSRQGARFLGCHLEGRYLNEKRRGTHAPELLASPDPCEMDRIISASAKPLRISLAPELDSGHKVISYLIQNGVQVGIAHTDASFEEAMLAAKDGCNVFTHHFNAMRPFSHREPGTVGAGLVSDAYIELICDGIHLHGATVQMAHKCKSQDQIVLITDSMAGAGCDDGEYEIAGQRVIVKDGKATAPDGAIAGSTLDLLSGMMNYAQFSGISVEEAIPAATKNPAICAGIYDKVGSLDIGNYADCVILDKDKKTHLFTLVGGEKIATK